MRRAGRRARYVISQRWVRQDNSVLAYWQKASAIQAANLLAYWRMNETSGAVAVDSSAQANNGAYTGVDLANAAGPDGVLCPYFDGANDCVGIHSAGLQTDFVGVGGTAGTISVWCKVYEAAVWTDSAQHMIVRLVFDGNNDIAISKLTSDGYLRGMYFAGGAFDLVDKTSVSDTAWFHYALTWNKAADQVIGYYNGVQIGAIQGSLGVFGAAALSSISCVGSSSTTPATVWKGWLSNCGIWKVTLTPVEVLALATV